MSASVGDQQPNICEGLALAVPVDKSRKLQDPPRLSVSVRLRYRSVVPWFRWRPKSTVVPMIFFAKLACHVESLMSRSLWKLQKLGEL